MPTSVLKRHGNHFLGFGQPSAILLEQRICLMELLLVLFGFYALRLHPLVIRASSAKL
jgi:hypothetical protein